MNALESAVATIFNNVYSLINATGYFDGGTQMHEPKSGPGPGLVCALWGGPLTPVQAASGLAATSYRLEMTARIYRPFMQEPADQIDVGQTMATAAVIGALSGDLDLGSAVRNVDLLGGNGQPLAGRPGYITIDKTSYRTMDITIPVIINDAVDQG